MDHSNVSSQDVAAIIGSFTVFFFIIFAIMIVVILVPASKILRKMGYSGWWSLLYFAPLGPIIGLWILATSKWPLEERAEAAKAEPLKADVVKPVGAPDA